MEIFIQTNGPDLLLRREALAKPEGGAEPFQEKEVRLEQEPIGCIKDTQITTGNFLIDHYSFQLTQPIQLVKEVEEDSIQLTFAIQGESQVQLAENLPRRSFATGEHAISYLPSSKSIYAYDASMLPVEYTVVMISRDVYVRLVPVDSDLYGPFISQIVQHKAAYLSNKALFMTPAMDWLIRDMRASQRTGSLKRLFLESKVIELLMLQLEQIQGAGSIPFSSKKEDIRKIHEARDVLDAYYPNSPTIVELAKLVGLNEFKLKRGFKEQLGMTILSYITQRRMEDARRLLLEGEKTISEIAYGVGYKNPTHFTVAFKQYFGVVPSAIRT